MPKATLNINDFSGGIVKNKNPRDIEDNECQESDGFISINPGELTLQSGFELTQGFDACEGGYQQEFLSQGIITTWGIQPEYAFRKFIVVKFISSSGGETTVEGVGVSNFGASDGSGLEIINHGLTTGLRVVNIRASGLNVSSKVTKVSDTQFKISDGLGISSGYALLALESNYISSGVVGPELGPAETSPLNNNYILKSYSMGLIGFYNVGSLGAGFFGDINTNEHPGPHGEDPWLFDIENLWDWRQTGRASTTQSGPFADTPIVDAFYDNGHFRTFVKPGEKWLYGYCRRPVSFIHFNDRINFFNDVTEAEWANYASSAVTDVGANRIFEGWFPLRSHILSPIEYKIESDGSNDPEYNTDYGNVVEAFTNSGVAPVGTWSGRDAVAGILASQPRDVTSLEFYGGRGDKRYSPRTAHRFVLAIGTGEGASEQVAGDWQFKTGDHTKIALGVSYIYDDIEFTRQLESTINPLEAGWHDESASSGSGRWNLGVTESGTTLKNWVYSDGTDGNDNIVADDLALNLSLVLNKGDYNSVPLNSSYINDESIMPASNLIASCAVGEQRGSGFNGGFSNRRSYNPRIVGINVWFTGDATGMFDDPYWLATFDFDSKKKAVSHDGVEGDGWNRDNDGTALYTNTSSVPYGSMVGQTISGIKKVPNITYKVKNGYDHKTITQAWYTTAAVVNRRLYAGNVSYFDFPVNKIRDIDDDHLITHKPDRILVSPVNKFDILPVTNFLDVVTEDGQDIVKLVGFGQKLLIFKHNDLFIVDASGEFEFLEHTHKGMGVMNPAMVTETPEYIFWLNSRGIYAYSKDGELVDVIENTIGIQEWKKHYCPSSHVSYDPENKQLIIHCASGYGGTRDNKVLIINITNASVFFKSRPAEDLIDYFSYGVIINDKLYVTGSNSNDVPEDFNNYQNDLYSQRGTAEGEAYFKLTGSTDSSPGKNRVGDNLNFLLVRKGSAWVCINTESFNIGGTMQSDIASAEYTIRHMNSRLSVNSEYSAHIDYNAETEFFCLKVKARDKGTAYNGTATDLSSGAGANFGSSALFAFSSTNNTDGSGIHDSNVTDWTNSGMDQGAADNTGSWIVKLNRNSETKKGLMYTLNVSLKRKLNDPTAGDIQLTNTYVTGEYNNYEKDRKTASYTWLNDCHGTPATADENLNKNFREFLESNPMIDQYGNKIFLDEYFTIGAVASSGSNSYFELTTRTDNVEEMEDTGVAGHSYNQSGGKIFTWSNITNDIPCLPKWDSKDFDFGQPNVRKKVYRGYITYKGNAGIKIYYKIDQSDTWTQATIKDDADNALDAATSFTRKEFNFTSGTTNNVYSISIRLIGSAATKDFTVNDITLVYRMKSVR